MIQTLAMSSRFIAMANPRPASRVSLAMLYALLLCFSGCTGRPVNDSVMLQQAVWVDPTGKVSIDEVGAQEFLPFSGPISRGYTTDVTWIRLRVAPSIQSPLVLTVQPTFLDDVRLYSENRKASRWSVQYSGDRMLAAQRPRPELNLAFELEPSSQTVTVHYLRIQTTSATFANIELRTPAESLRFDEIFAGLTGFYCGLVFLLVASSALGAWISKDRLWVLNCLMQASALMVAFFFMGLASRYGFSEYPQVADIGVSVLSCLHLFMISLFFWQLFKAYRAPPWTTFCYRVGMVLFPVCLLLIAMGMPQRAVALNAQLILILTLAEFVIIWFVPIADLWLRRMLRTMFVTLALYGTGFVLPLLGLLPMTELNLYPALLSNLIAGLMLLAILMRRTQLEVRERWALHHQMSTVNEMLNKERERIEEMAGFLGMLMHELRTPLASIKISAESLRGQNDAPAGHRNARVTNILHSVDGINSVIEHCLSADQLEQHAIRVVLTRTNIVGLIEEVCADHGATGRVQVKTPAAFEASTEKTLLPLMLRNLLVNAINYSPPQSTVAVVLRSDSEAGRPGYRIEVCNDIGRAGVPDPEQLFTKYYRAPGAHQVTGTGLGLYWVKGVARMLEGDIFFEHDDMRHQVIFSLWLPNLP